MDDIIRNSGNVLSAVPDNTKQCSFSLKVSEGLILFWKIFQFYLGVKLIVKKVEDRWKMCNTTVKHIWAGVVLDLHKSLRKWLLVKIIIQIL